MTNQSHIYKAFIYLQRINSSGLPEKYNLYFMLWMPKNYKLIGMDNAPPKDTDSSSEDMVYHRLILEDADAERPDEEECHAIMGSIDNLEKPVEKEVLLLHYTVSNQTQNKIPKKPKSKIAYIHADLGGSNPNPIPPDLNTTQI